MRLIVSLLILGIVVFVAWTYYPEAIERFLSWIQSGLEYIKAQLPAKAAAIGPHKA